MAPGGGRAFSDPIDLKTLGAIGLSIHPAAHSGFVGGICAFEESGDLLHWRDTGESIDLQASTSLRLESEGRLPFLRLRLEAPLLGPGAKVTVEILPDGPDGPRGEGGTSS